MSEAAGDEVTSSPAVPQTRKKMLCVIVVGMAGAGKTSVVQRLAAHLHAADKPPYIINLDPAVLELSYPCNIDIRDTVKYKEVMKQYGLGPNGAILTSLNLFTTKFEEVLEILEARSDEKDYCIIDTPGQIEAFTWSASGAIVTEALAGCFPTCVLYVADTARCAAPVTFMSNMTYACSILYKTRLPFSIVFNKIDVVGCSKVLEWLRDWETFHEALQSEHSYSANLAHSLSLVLDEFYHMISADGFSAVTGAGCEELLTTLDKLTVEYWSEYRPMYDNLAKSTLASRMDNVHIGPQRSSAPTQEKASEEESAEMADFMKFVEETKKKRPVVEQGSSTLSSTQVGDSAGLSSVPEEETNTNS